MNIKIRVNEARGSILTLERFESKCDTLGIDRSDVGRLFSLLMIGKELAPSKDRYIELYDGDLECFIEDVKLSLQPKEIESGVKYEVVDEYEELKKYEVLKDVNNIYKLIDIIKKGGM